MRIFILFKRLELVINWWAFVCVCVCVCSFSRRNLLRGVNNNNNININSILKSAARILEEELNQLSGMNDAKQDGM